MEEKRKLVFRANSFIEKKEGLFVSCVMFPLCKIESDKGNSGLKKLVEERYKANRKVLLNKIGNAIKILVLELETLSEKKEKRKGLIDLKFNLKSDNEKYNEETFLLEIEVVLVPTIVPLFGVDFEYDSILLQIDLESKEESK